MIRCALARIGPTLWLHSELLSADDEGGRLDGFLADESEQST